MIDKATVLTSLADCERELQSTYTDTLSGSPVQGIELITRSLIGVIRVLAQIVDDCPSTEALSKGKPK